MKKLTIDSKPLIDQLFQSLAINELVGGAMTFFDENTIAECLGFLKENPTFPPTGIVWKYPEQVLSLKMQCWVADLVQKHCEANPDYNVEILTTSVAWLSRIKFDEKIEIVKGEVHSIMYGYGATVDGLWRHQQ